MTRTAPILVLAAATLTACGVPEPADLQVTRDLSMSERTLVGVAVQPDGRIAVLDENEGVYTVDLEAAEWTRVAGPQVLMRDGVDLRPYTDIVAMDDGVFAVTVENDGLRLDVETQTTTQHFCYLPGEELGEVDPQQSQLTHAVGYDPELDVLFAQPQTFFGGVLESAEVGTYSGTAGGQPEGWFELKHEDFRAGGMVWDGDRLLMADAQNVLHSYTLGDDKPVPYVDLAALDLGTIEGMALRPDGTLVLVDTDQLVEVTGWRPEADVERGQSAN